MKFEKKILEEKIDQEIKQKKEIVGYCVVKALKLPFPAIIIPVGLVLLAYLSSQSRLFFILFIAFLIYIIKSAITSWEYFILTFLNKNIQLLQIEGEDLDIVNKKIYSYEEVSYVFTYLDKNLYLAFADNSSKRYNALLQPNNSSFTLKEFDVKKFCEERK